MKYLFIILLIFKLAFTYASGEVINNIEVKTVKSVDEVIKIALTKELKPVEWMEVEVTKSKDGEKISTLTN